MKKLIAALLLMLLALPQFAVAENAPSVTITLDKDTVAVGETVTATYAVSGEGKYTIEWDWLVHADVDDWQWIGTGERTLESMSGYYQATPKFGMEIKAVLNLVGETGQSYMFESEAIPVTGDTSEKPEVKIVLNKPEVGIGETVIATYEIKGNGNYSKVEWDWLVLADENDWQWIGDGDRTHYTLSGSFQATPKFGNGIKAVVNVYEDTGRMYWFESELIPVKNDDSKEPVVQLVLDKKGISLGEKITATYEVRGEGNYTNIEWDWLVLADEDDWQWIGDGDTASKELTGSYHAVPRFGEEIKAVLFVDEDTGRRYWFESEIIPISGFADNYDIYTVIEGQNSQIFDGTNSLTFRADGSFEKYLGVQVDGKNVPQRYVTAWSGSTYVELSKEYLASLPEGEHELTIIFNDGVAVTTFSMGALEEETVVPDLPQTGDNSALGAWVMLLAAAAVLLAQMKRTEQMNG